MELFQHVLDDESLSAALHLGPAIVRALNETKLTVSLVETITSGAVSFYLRSLVPSSQFLGAVICDHPSSYLYLAGLSPATYRLVSHTPKAFAHALAEAFQAKTKSAVTLATAGYLGKTVDKSAYQAAVDVCFIIDGDVKQKRFQATGSRSEILNDISHHVLAYLKQYLSNYAYQRSHLYG